MKLRHERNEELTSSSRSAEYRSFDQFLSSIVSFHLDKSKPAVQIMLYSTQLSAFTPLETELCDL